jgi:predicted dehydrogenase
MSKPLAIAVFGAGPLAQPYVAALQARHDLLVIAIGDANAEVAKQAAAPWSARAWSDPVTMLQEEAPEAFFALAPASQLGTALEQAIQQRIPFFVEPPGVNDWPAAARLAQQVEAQSLITAMSFPYRSVDVVREAKEFLSSQPLHLARGTWFVPSAASLKDLLWHDACRLVDLLRFFLGDIDKVQALVADNSALVISVQAKRGAVGTFALRSQQLSEAKIEVELPGEKWSLLFTDGMTRLHFTEQAKTTILRRMSQPEAEQVVAFLDAVRRQDRQRVACSFGEGVKTLAVCEGARRALEKGQAVTLTETGFQ